MKKPQGIIIFGPNGSGKTTLGREAARILNFKHMDHEDYAFAESEIPYTAERTKDECMSLMLADMEKYGSFVLTAVTGDFGDIIPKYYKLAVSLTAPLELRLNRIERRQIDRFDDRVRKNGDMHEQQQRFMEFVASRSPSRIEQWAKTIACPIIHIDGTEDWRVNAVKIAERFRLNVLNIGNDLQSINQERY